MAGTCTNPGAGPSLPHLPTNAKIHYRIAKPTGIPAIKKTPPSSYPEASTPINQPTPYVASQPTIKSIFKYKSNHAPNPRRKNGIIGEKTIGATLPLSCYNIFPHHKNNTSFATSTALQEPCYIINTPSPPLRAFTRLIPSLHASIKNILSK